MRRIDMDADHAHLIFLSPHICFEVSGALLSYIVRACFHFQQFVSAAVQDRYLWCSYPIGDMNSSAEYLFIFFPLEEKSKFTELQLS